jgi:hypothetical protein
LFILLQDLGKYNIVNGAGCCTLLILVVAYHLKPNYIITRLAKMSAFSPPKTLNLIPHMSA